MGGRLERLNFSEKYRVYTLLSLRVYFSPFGIIKNMKKKNEVKNVSTKIIKISLKKEQFT